MIISLFETVGLSVSISPRNLYNSLKSIKEKILLPGERAIFFSLRVEPHWEDGRTENPRAAPPIFASTHLNVMQLV